MVVVKHGVYIGNSDSETSILNDVHLKTLEDWALQGTVPDPWSLGVWCSPWPSQKHLASLPSQGAHPNFSVENRGENISDINGSGDSSVSPVAPTETDSHQI